MRKSAIAGALLALLLPATAFAKAPTVSTGSAVAIEQTTATVRGKVNPQNNVGVVAFFQYGGNKLYGSQTPDIPLSASSKAQSVSAALSGLAPYTTYHYRVVARRGNTYRIGEDRTFRTDRQPLGLSLTATPSVVSSGGSTTLAGNLSGTGNEGRQVRLQSQAFGTTEFTDLGNTQVVDASGNFAFPILGVPVNTAYKVFLPGKPEIASPIVFVTVPIKVRLKATKRIRRGHRATFKGRVSPTTDAGSLVEIQQRFHGVWVTVAKTTLQSDGTHYKRRVKLRRGGRFRALVTPGGAYVQNASGTHRVRVRR